MKYHKVEKLLVKIIALSSCRFVCTIQIYNASANSRLQNPPGVIERESYFHFLLTTAHLSLVLPVVTAVT